MHLRISVVLGGNGREFSTGARTFSPRERERERKQVIIHNNNKKEANRHQAETTEVTPPPSLTWGRVYHLDTAQCNGQDRSVPSNVTQALYFSTPRPSPRPPRPRLSRTSHCATAARRRPHLDVRHRCAIEAYRTRNRAHEHCRHSNHSRGNLPKQKERGKTKQRNEYKKSWN